MSTACTYHVPVKAYVDQSEQCWYTSDPEGCPSFDPVVYVSQEAGDNDVIAAQHLSPQRGFAFASMDPPTDNLKVKAWEIIPPYQARRFWLYCQAKHAQAVVRLVQAFHNVHIEPGSADVNAVKKTEIGAKHCWLMWPNMVLANAKQQRQHYVLLLNWAISPEAAEIFPDVTALLESLFEWSERFVVGGKVEYVCQPRFMTTMPYRSDIQDTLPGLDWAAVELSQTAASKPVDMPTVFDKSAWNAKGLITFPAVVEQGLLATLCTKELGELHPSTFGMICKKGRVEMRGNQHRCPFIAGLTHEQRVGNRAILAELQLKPDGTAWYKCRVCAGGPVVQLGNVLQPKAMGQIGVDTYRNVMRPLDRKETLKLIPMNQLHQLCSKGFSGLARAIVKLFLDPFPLIKEQAGRRAWLWSGWNWKTAHNNDILHDLVKSTCAKLVQWCIDDIAQHGAPKQSSHESDEDVWDEADSEEEEYVPPKMAKQQQQSQKASLRFLRSLLRQIEAGKIAEVRRSIRPMTMDEFFDQRINAHPGYVATNSGMLHMESGSLRRPRPDDGVQGVLPWHFRPSKVKTKSVAKVFKAMMQNDSALYDHMRWLVGYTLVGDCSKKMIVVSWGPKHGGKTLFSKALQAAFPVYLRALEENLATSSGRSATAGNRARTDILSLVGYRGAFQNETAAGATWNSPLMKALASGDVQSLRRHGEAAYRDYAINLVAWIMTNFRPEPEHDDEAMLDRLVPLPFSVVFRKLKRGERPGPLLQQSDETLTYAFQTPNVQEQVFHWGVECAQYYCRNRNKPFPARIQAWRQHMKTGSATACQFARVELGMNAPGAEPSMWKSWYDDYVRRSGRSVRIAKTYGSCMPWQMFRQQLLAWSQACEQVKRTGGNL